MEMVSIQIENDGRVDVKTRPNGTHELTQAANDPTIIYNGSNYSFKNGTERPKRVRRGTAHQRAITAINDLAEIGIPDADLHDVSIILRCDPIRAGRNLSLAYKRGYLIRRKDKRVFRYAVRPRKGLTVLA